MSLCRAESTRPGCRLGDWRGSPRGSAPVPSAVLSGGQLCDPVDGSPPGSSVYESLQAMILEWVTISFSRRSSRRDQTHVSYIPCIAGRFFTTEPPGKCYLIGSPRKCVFVSDHRKYTEVK